MAGNGHIILTLPICVDYWLKTPAEKYFHFLSHLHADHTVGLKSTFREKIYTSNINKWLLVKWFDINPNQIITVDIGEKKLLAKPDESEDPISVTFIDANHCPGSLMFLFQGNFGNILYTGDFRYTPDMLKEPSLKTVIETEALDRLFLDNTYAAEHCEFPPKDEVFESIIELIRSHPDHYILIAMRKLGKEEIITKIGLLLKEKIWVSQERFSLLNFLNCPEVFTTSREDSRIFAVPWTEIQLYKNNLQEEKGPVLTIIPSAIFQASKNPNPKDVYVFPYSDHSCHSELKSFVSEVKPRYIYPIVSYPKVKKTDFARLGLFGYQKSPSEESLYCNTAIPRSILRYSRSGQEHDTAGITNQMLSIGQQQTNSSELLTLDIRSKLCFDADDANENRKRERLRNAFVSGNVDTLMDNMSLQNASSIISSDESFRAPLEHSVHHVPNVRKINESISCEDSDSSEYHPLSQDEINQQKSAIKNDSCGKEKVKSCGENSNEYVPLSQNESAVNNDSSRRQQLLSRLQVLPYDDEVEKVFKSNFNHAFESWRNSVGSFKK